MIWVVLIVLKSFLVLKIDDKVMYVVMFDFFWVFVVIGFDVENVCYLCFDFL